jgi:hypothetical protein
MVGPRFAFKQRRKTRVCFPNTTTSTQNKVSTPNPAVGNAATQNLNYVSNLQDAGYTPYSGPRVADFGSLQNTGFDVAGQTAAGPYIPTAQDLISNYSSAPAGSVNAGTIAQNMGPYMNAYTSMALAPQLAAQANQFAGQNKQLDAAATSSGAYGDSRTGIEAANLGLNQDLARQGLVGQAYTNAFNTAIGAGAQDVGNSLQAQTTNANLQEQALQRQLGGATAEEGLGGYQMGLSNFLQQQGGLQQQQAQAQLNVPYSNYLAAQQYPFLLAQLMNQSTTAGATAMPASTMTTNQQPNNWLASLLGSAVGTGVKTLAAAEGGGVPGDQPILVGERGPEVIWPGKSGVVIPNEVLEAARALRTAKVGNAPPTSGYADGVGLFGANLNTGNPGVNDQFSQLINALHTMARAGEGAPMPAPQQQQEQATPGAPTTPTLPSFNLSKLFGSTAPAPAADAGAVTGDVAGAMLPVPAADGRGLFRMTGAGRPVPTSLASPSRRTRKAKGPVGYADGGFFPGSGWAGGSLTTTFGAPNTPAAGSPPHAAAPVPALPAPAQVATAAVPAPTAPAALMPSKADVPPPPAPAPAPQPAVPAAPAAALMPSRPNVAAPPVMPFQGMTGGGAPSPSWSGGQDRAVPPQVSQWMNMLAAMRARSQMAA